MFHNDRFLVLFFSLFSSTITITLSRHLLPSVVLFMLTNWPSGLLPLGLYCSGGQGALIRLEGWCLPFNSIKYDPSFSVNLCQANLQLYFFLFNSSFPLNTTQTLGSLLTAPFPSLHMLLCLRSNSSLV